MQRLLDKLVIGTAQFGQDYGVTNKAGQVSKEETLSIIKKLVFTMLPVLIQQVLMGAVSISWEILELMI